MIRTQRPAVERALALAFLLAALVIVSLLTATTKTAHAATTFSRLD